MTWTRPWLGASITKKAVSHSNTEDTGIMSFSPVQSLVPFNYSCVLSCKPSSALSQNGKDTCLAFSRWPCIYFLALQWHVIKPTSCVLSTNSLQWFAFALSVQSFHFLRRYSSPMGMAMLLNFPFSLHHLFFDSTRLFATLAG